MKLEKRSADLTEPVQPSRPEAASVKKERSHVLVYILILFIAAFLLMTLSFLSHQHSNEQILGQLNSTTNALESLQTALEENVRLQQQIASQQLQLEKLEKTAEDTRKALEAAEGETSSLQQQLDTLQKELDTMRQQMGAMDTLAQLQRLFINSDMNSCRILIADMEARGLDKLLPTSAASTVGVAPSQLFQQLKLLTAAAQEPQVPEAPAG